MNELSSLNLYHQGRMNFVRSIGAKSDRAVKIIEAIRIEVTHDSFAISVFQGGDEDQFLDRLLLN